ncbi:MAG: sulfotransferase [Planctomycetota bacterium]
MQRVFMVGCPRSGTSLAQSFLAAHPRVLSLPETHFYRFLSFNSIWREFGVIDISGKTLRRSLKGWAAWARGQANAYARTKLEAVLTETGAEHEIQNLPASPTQRDANIDAFPRLLDRLAQQRGRTAWVEKSPDHINYLDLIERHVPDARFIHVVRRGPDVVASMIDAAQRYPDSSWATTYPNPMRAARRWRLAIRATRSRLGQPAHAVINYHELVADPDATLEPLCNFVGVDYDPDIITARTQAVGEIATDAEPWKQGLRSQAIQDRGAEKFQAIFTPAQQRRIQQALAGIEPPATRIPTTT